MNDLKAKEDNILALTNELNNLANKNAQGDNSTKIELVRLKE